MVCESPKPPPPIIRREREFVEVEVPSKRLKAIERAMDEYGRRYPSARSVVETIESYADQYEAAEK